MSVALATLCCSCVALSSFVPYVPNLDHVALAVAMLFALIYAQKFSYSADLHYTFEVIQKMIKDLDVGKRSNKAGALSERGPFIVLQNFI
ncbi:unnamed protein product [Tetraodon nigroviridis]|uniref:(spotted green pufferfish) hypothetical protein n=1 Tax=Tetraodon nigroviridis TaxID=99883 RepID=Q4SVX7_TETNG|nr:unnamed protein product [Tetraodon nigroviridis]